MTLADRLIAADAWLLDRCFQPLTDWIGEKPSAFELGLSLQLGAVVFELAADLALFAGGLLTMLDGLYDALSAACGIWFYIYISSQRSLVSRGKANPLRVMYRSLRLVGLGLSVWSLFSSATSDVSGAISNGLTALSSLAFVAGLYFISCQPRPPGWRRAVRSRPVEASGLA
jgi:hypothetical protein